MSYHILHVEDDPLMRDLVELSLALDPSMKVFACDSGDHVLATAIEWAPDLILCDVNMPNMDGPAVLAALRKNPLTADIPLVFITAHAPPAEAARLVSLGATAVIAKPFVPKTLAATIRSFLPARGPAPASAAVTAAAAPPRMPYDFNERLRADAAKLSALRLQLVDEGAVPIVPPGLQTCVHQLAGAAGVFEFTVVSESAASLEEIIIERRAGRGVPGAISTNLDALLACISRH